MQLMILKISIKDWLIHYQPCSELTIKRVVCETDILKVTKLRNIYFVNPANQLEVEDLFLERGIRVANSKDIDKPPTTWYAPRDTVLLTTSWAGKLDEVFLTNGLVQVEGGDEHTSKQRLGCFLRCYDGSFYPRGSTTSDEFDFDSTLQVFVKKT